MSVFEIIITFIGSSFFLALLGIFYKLGWNQSKIEAEFKRIDERFLDIHSEIHEMRSDIREMRKDISRIDREVGIITATLKFNGFDLDRHKAEGE